MGIEPGVGKRPSIGGSQVDTAIRYGRRPGVDKVSGVGKTGMGKAGVGECLRVGVVVQSSAKPNSLGSRRKSAQLGHGCRGDTANVGVLF